MMRSGKFRSAAAVGAGWLVAFAGGAVCGLLALGPAASLAFEALFALGGGWVAAGLFEPARARADLTLLAAACELNAVVSAYLAAELTPAWFYAASFLFPVPLVLFGGALRLVLCGGADALASGRRITFRPPPGGA